MTPLEADVLRLCRISTTIAELAILLAVPRRSVEEAVENLRVQGEPIIADNSGLRLTEDADELERYLAARRRRAASIYIGTRSLRVTARRMREASDERSGLTLWA